MAIALNRRATPVDKLSMYATISESGLVPKLLDITAVRHQVLAQNTANVNTPGYHRLDVSFDDVFAKKLGQKDARSAATLFPGSTK